MSVRFPSTALGKSMFLEREYFRSPRVESILRADVVEIEKLREGDAVLTGDISWIV